MNWITKRLSRFATKRSCQHASLRVDIIQRPKAQPQLRIQMYCRCTGEDLLLGTWYLNHERAEQFGVMVTRFSDRIRDQIRSTCE